MQSTYCTLAVILENLPRYPELENIRYSLVNATSLTKEYHKVKYSIFWNKSRINVKRNIKHRCNKLAFDAYSSMNEISNLINQYAKAQNLNSLPEPRYWHQLVKDLNFAYDQIEKDHQSEIKSLQLELTI
jgi:hypothetical protein